MSDATKTTAVRTRGATSVGSSQPSSDASTPPPARRRRWLGALAVLAGVAALWAFWPRDYGPEPAAPSANDAPFHFGSPESQRNLELAIEISRETNARLAQVHDYTGRMTKRERYKGNLLPQEEMIVKVREKPFSAYVRHTAPDSKAGQEAIYVDGLNDNKLVAHAVGPGAFLGRLHLRPTGWLAMMDNLHPITDIGLRNLIKQLLEMADKQRDYLLACHIEIIEDAQLNGRPCRKLDIRSQRPSATFRMAVAQIYFDKEWQVPVHYEAYDFPPGDDAGEPILMEQYTWHDLKFNVGLTDMDFNPDNPQYQFP